MVEELLGPLSAVRLIRGIDPSQADSLEAIGFGLDTVDLVYRRLAATLRGLDPAPSPLVFADAWAIVDWTDRIDTLVEHCPGLSHRDEAVRDFLNTSSLVAAEAGRPVPWLTVRAWIECDASGGRHLLDPRHTGRDGCRDQGVRSVGVEHIAMWFKGTESDELVRRMERFQREVAPLA